MTCSLEMLMANRTKPINVRRIQRYNNLLIGIYSSDRLVCHRSTPKGSYALI
ncbi:unnamed protein product, partial [Rotaria sordida]